MARPFSGPPALLLDAFLMGCSISGLPAGATKA